MKVPKRAKYPKKPRAPKKPKQPKGGFKSLTAIDAFNAKVKDWQNKLKDIEKQHAAKVKAIDAQYAKDQAEYKKFVAAKIQVKKTLSGLSAKR